MKNAILAFFIFAACLNFSCRQSAQSAPVSANELTEPAALVSSTPDKYAEIDIIERFSTDGQENPPNSLEYNGYRIKRVQVLKKDSETDSPEAEIDDAVLTKNGKTVARFEGIYYPLGNSMSFGLYPFLNDVEKQLFIVEESNRYDREWIVNLAPKYEVLFDADDFDVIGGYLTVLDIESDGEKEISLSKSCRLGFDFAESEVPRIPIIFKFDREKRKYLPVSHKFPEYTLKDQAEQIHNFDENRKGVLAKVLQIFMTYAYAGKDDEAWRFFEEKLPEKFKYTVYGDEKEKSEIRKALVEALKNDKIYRFVQNDLKRKK